MEERVTSSTKSSALTDAKADKGRISQDERKSNTIDINESAHKCARRERKIILGLKRVTHDLSTAEKIPQFHNGAISNGINGEMSPHNLVQLKRMNILRSKRRMMPLFNDKATPTPTVELSSHKIARLRRMNILRSKQGMTPLFIDEINSLVDEPPRNQALRKLVGTAIVRGPEHARRIRKEILNAKCTSRPERVQHCKRKCTARIIQSRLASHVEKRRQCYREKKAQMTEEQVIVERARNRQRQRDRRARMTKEQLGALRERNRRRYIKIITKQRQSYMQWKRDHERQMMDFIIDGARFNVGKCSTESIECIVDVPVLGVEQLHVPNSIHASKKRPSEMNNLPPLMEGLKEVPIVEVRSINEVEGMLGHSGFNCTIFLFGTSQ